MILAQKSNERAIRITVNFVAAEAEVARAFCWLAKIDEHKRERCLGLAKEAHARAAKALPSFAAKPGRARLVAELDELSREFVRFESGPSLPNDYRLAAE